MQALYSMQVADVSARVALRTAIRLTNDGYPDEDPDELTYGEQLVDDVERDRSRIDRLLGGAGSNWRVDRMSPLDLQILRIAVVELLRGTEDLPPPVVIDEAIELAKEFGGESSPGFVNGVLDAVARGLASGGNERGAPKGEGR